MIPHMVQPTSSKPYYIYLAGRKPTVYQPVLPEREKVIIQIPGTISAFNFAIYSHHVGSFFMSSSSTGGWCIT